MPATARYTVEEDEPPEPHREVEAIFRQHADFVWRALRRHGLSETDADDAVQEVFLVVHRRFQDYEERGSMRAWLYAISRQVAAHHRRAAVRKERRERPVMAVVEASETPHDSMLRREAVSIVNDFLSELDDSQATVFCLTEIEGMTGPEIATALGVGLNTVYARLRLARKRFERLIKRTNPKGGIDDS